MASQLNASSSASETPSRVSFTPSSGLVRISPNLFMLSDTCNVYLLRDGDRGLLIDFGSGHILKLLGEFGIVKVEGILHTHHHRDQCQGGAKAVTQNIPIYVPAHEKYLFEGAENFWRNRHILDNYDVRNDFFTLTKNNQVAGILRDYDSFRWGPYSFLILPTPGHTLGAISLIGRVDGRKVAFTGDLIHSPGKVLNLYDLQYEYQSSDGVDCAIYSLTKLRDLAPALICPSHGTPFENPGRGISDLVDKLKGWYALYSPESLLTVDSRPFAVSPHLACAYKDTSTVYALISDSGKALFVDYGGASLNFLMLFNGGVQRGSVHDHMRFVEHAHTIQELEARFGMKSIDVALPSHMHDDHIGGFPYLVQNYGTKIWCYENMVDILQNPRGYNLGCTYGEPIKVDRSFRDRETFKWEEFEFTVCHFPGHTEFQMVMFGVIDGARVAFTADNFFPWPPPSHIWPHDFPAYELRHQVCFRNWVESDSHLKSVRTLIEYEPTMMAPGHGKPFVSNKQDLEDLKPRLAKQKEYFSSVIADPDCNFGLNPSWVRIYPYQLRAKAGSTASLELRVRNYRSKPMRLEATLMVPSSWKSLPERLTVEAPPYADSGGGFTVSIPENWDPSRSRVAVAADVVADGRYLGEIAEGIVDLVPVDSKAGRALKYRTK
jgi:glyoxylase-like metal-dependent hydrolase (beta-lactamase superfamily II)